MDRKATKDITSFKFTGASPIEKIVSDLAESLPLLDSKMMAAAVAEVKEHPRASLKYLLEQFSHGTPIFRGLAARLVSEVGGSDVVDNLNAIIFDASQDPMVKVLANTLLARLDSPVDPDVFAMSVPDAAELEIKIPSRALTLLSNGDMKGALEHARMLAESDRWLVMYCAAEKMGAKALPFLQALAQDNEANSIAAAGAIAQKQIQEGLPLLLEWQQSGSREFQKMIKRMLYDLRKDGMEIPEDKTQQAEPGSAPEPEDEPVFRAMISEPTPSGLALVTVARLRSNGRLKVFSVVLDYYKRGIQQAGLRLDMSRSSFERFVSGQARGQLKMREATLEECVRAVARGARVAKEFGMPLPFDFGVGRPVLGDVDSAMAEMEEPFLCSACGAALSAAAVERIRSAAPYENMPVETRCEKCISGAGNAGA